MDGESIILVETSSLQLDELLQDYKRIEGKELNINNAILIGICLSTRGACEAKARELLIQASL